MTRMRIECLSQRRLALGLAQGATLALLLLAGAGSFSRARAMSPARKPSPLRWTMVNVNAGDDQGDAHLIEFPDDTNLLIDAGGAGKTAALLKVLESRHITRLDRVLITHAHKDHYGGILDLFERRIRIGAVYFNPPERELCDEERPWGCDYEHVQNILRRIRESGAKVLPVRERDLLYSQGSTRLRILYAYDGINTPVGKTDINGMSVVARLEHEKDRVLFTGDLGYHLGAYLAKSSRELEAEILKIPHHGAESSVPESFLERVNPRLALVPAPKQLWLSDRCRRVREYLASRNIPTYVNGLEGNIVIEWDEHGYHIHTERASGLFSWLSWIPEIPNIPELPQFSEAL